MQPVVRGWPKGDCGPCVLAGMLNWPGDPLTAVTDVYQNLRRDGLIQAFTAEDMRDTLSDLHAKGMVEYYNTDLPSWGPYSTAWGRPAHITSPEWARYIDLGMRAGCYAIVQIQSKTTLEDLAPDHWALLTGFYYGNDGPYVRLSCSNTGDQWLTAKRFLQTRGGFHAYLVKPSKG